MAWAPPTGCTASAPAMAAAASTTSGTPPSGPGGTHTDTHGTPATLAGMTVISTVDG